MFYVINDTLVSMLRQRSNAYGELSIPGQFGFLTNLHTLSTVEMRTASRNLVQTYSTDLQPEIEDELVQFVSLCRHMTTDFSPSNMMRLLKEQQLQCAFPNVDIVLRIYLTLPVSNATGERSFSKLGLVFGRP